jgi:Predicted acyltransferases
MLLINAGGEHGLVRFISNPLSRSLGAISYSLYLWHWPLLLMAKALAPGSAIMTLAAVLLAILLAWFSWRLIEGPTRRLETRRPLRWLAASALVTGSVIAVTVNLPPVNSLAEQEQVSTQLYSKSACPGFTRHRTVTTGTAAIPWWNVWSPLRERNAPRLLLVGDSIGAQWTPALEAIALAHGWQFSVYTKSACPMLDVEFHYPRINRRYTECETWREKVLEVIAQSPPDVLLLGSTSGYPFWRNGMAERRPAPAGSKNCLHSYRSATWHPHPCCPLILGLAC